jgi:hypothetical protein
VNECNTFIGQRKPKSLNEVKFIDPSRKLYKSMCFVQPVSVLAFFLFFSNVHQILCFDSEELPL